MVYQRGYKLEELDIVKEEFNRVEQKLTKLMRNIMKTYAFLAISMSFANSIIMKNMVPQYFSIAFNSINLGAYLTVLKLYLANNYFAWMEMKKGHHEAFKSHNLR